MPAVYEELVDFLAAGTTPDGLMRFTPSQAARDHLANLLDRERQGMLSPEEQRELDHYLQLEHLMRLAKARARRQHEQ